ncbi:TetR family transcriptional regulator, partial [Bacillus sp. S34]|nr:TetR family transcriptional regulator [Bacillus sp. S34]
MYTLGMPIAMLGLYIALLPPVLVAMALKVAEIAPDNQAGVLGLALGIGAFAAMVAERAGASIGTVYRYFPARIAVV